MMGLACGLTVPGVSGLVRVVLGRRKMELIIVRKRTLWRFEEILVLNE